MAAHKAGDCYRGEELHALFQRSLFPSSLSEDSRTNCKATNLSKSKIPKLTYFSFRPSGTAMATAPSLVSKSARMVWLTKDVFKSPSPPHVLRLVLPPHG
jgi:hypothetical protein